MSFSHILSVKDGVHISRVKNQELRQFFLYIVSKRKEIIPTEDTCYLITLCDGMHALEEIVSHFVETIPKNSKFKLAVYIF